VYLDNRPRSMQILIMKIGEYMKNCEGEIKHSLSEEYNNNEIYETLLKKCSKVIKYIEDTYITIDNLFIWKTDKQGYYMNCTKNDYEKNMKLDIYKNFEEHLSSYKELIITNS
jgi:hypothetical protein